MEQAQALMQIAGSMAVAVAALGSLGMAGAWIATRKQACNPYGYDACACGCGTDCAETPGG